MFPSPLTSTPAIALNGMEDRAVKMAPTVTSLGSKNEPLATNA